MWRPKFKRLPLHPIFVVRIQRLVSWENFRILKIRIIWAILIVVRFFVKRNLIRMKIDLSVVINLNGFQKLLFLFISISFHSHLFRPWHFLHRFVFLSSYVACSTSKRRTEEWNWKIFSEKCSTFSFQVCCYSLLRWGGRVKLVHFCLSHLPLPQWSKFHVAVYFTLRHSNKFESGLERIFREISSSENKKGKKKSKIFQLCCLYSHLEFSPPRRLLLQTHSWFSEITWITLKAFMFHIRSKLFTPFITCLDVSKFQNLSSRISQILVLIFHFDNNRLFFNFQVF